MDRDVIERLMYTNIRYLVGIHRYKVFAIPILNRVIRRLIALVSKRTLKELGAEMRYVDDGKELHIITKAQPPAIQHPDSKQTIWFNDMHGHSHYLTMKLNPQSGWLNQPTRDVQTGNYKNIREDEYEKIHAIISRHTVGVKWEKGDLLLIDNYAVLHGRKPFKGAREVSAAFTK